MKAALRVAVAVLAIWIAASVPATGEEPPTLPSPETILHQLAERVQTQRAAPRPFQYVCTRQTLTEELDKEGRVTERSVKVGQTRSHPGGAVEAGKWSRRNGISLDEELLRRFTFTVTGREVIRGRSAFVLTFVPRDPPAPVRHLQDRVLNRTMGIIWVDEAESEVVRADINLREAVSFGILGAIHFFSFRFERERDPEGEWLTRWTDTTVDARKLLKAIQTRTRVEWSEFKRVTS